MTRVAALLLGLVLAFPAWAEPALFVARGPGITAFLLGSFHALRPGTEWEGGAVHHALAASSECWFEIVLPDDPASAMAPILARGIDPAHPLSAQLSPADAKRLRQRAEALHLPGGVATLEIMRPWMAWIALVAGTLKDAGLDERKGVEVTLQRETKDAGKTLVGLETLEQQLGIFADLPPRAALKLLHDLLARPVPPSRAVEPLLAAWQKGDIEAVGRQMNALERGMTPSLADALLRRRNAAWAARLGTEEGTGKTILVTVGTGHLVGRGNLRELLAQRHWTVERVKEGKEP